MQRLVPDGAEHSPHLPFTAFANDNVNLNRTGARLDPVDAGWRGSLSVKNDTHLSATLDCLRGLSPMNNTGQTEQSSEIDLQARQWAMFLHFSLLANSGLVWTYPLSIRFFISDDDGSIPAQ